MDFVKTDVLGEDRDDECDGGYQSVPQSSPKAGDAAFLIGRFFGVIRTGSAACAQENQGEGEENSQSLLL
jgi:hypothetical protein